MKAEEHTHESDAEDDDEDKGKRGEGSGSEKCNENEKESDFKLDTEEEDMMGELKVNDNEGKMRTLKEWTGDTKEFMKDHVWIKVNMSDKDKRIFETVNELN